MIATVRKSIVHCPCTKVGRCWQSVLCQAEKFGGWKTKIYGEKIFGKNPAVFCELAKICRNFSLFTKSVKGANWCFVFRYHLPLIAVSSIKRKRLCNYQREEITISTKDDFRFHYCPFCLHHNYCRLPPSLLRKFIDKEANYFSFQVWIQRNIIAKPLYQGELMLLFLTLNSHATFWYFGGY